MTIRPIALAVALVATLAFAQAAAAQPITLHVTSARTVTNQPDPVPLTGTISLAPNCFSRRQRVIYSGLAHTMTRYKQKCERSCNPERDEISQGNAFSLRLLFLSSARRKA